MMGQLLAVAGPTEMPVSTLEAADHLRLDAPQLDELQLLIEAAVSYLDGPEGILGRCLMRQTWDLKLDAFPTGLATSGPWVGLQIPLDPLQSVTWVRYLDAEGLETEWPATEYVVDVTRGQVYPGYGKTYPTTQAIPNAVTVRFLAGYTPTTLPAADKLLVLWLVAQWHEHREPVVVGQTAQAIPEGLERLINARRRWSVA